MAETTMLTPGSDAAHDQLVLGRALGELRRRAGVTQEELATRASTDASYVSQLENGHRGARWHTVLRLLSAMDASLGDLTTEVENHYPPPKG
ncbi:MAG: helix-turn-helix transcriptional regulator [Solirubrobacteraceae bacterium]